ncbi:Pyridoxal 4-dehydrogenase [compost metagenome]
MKKTSLIVGGVFNSGILATGPVEGAHFDYMPASSVIREKVGAMERIALERGVPLAAAAMQFPLDNPVVASVLLGTAKPESLRRNADALRHKLSSEDFAAFEPYTLVAPELGLEAVRA